MKKYVLQLDNIDTILQDFNGSTPIFPLPDFVLFPLTGHRFQIFEPRYLDMIHDVIIGNNLLTMTLLQPGWEDQYKGDPKFQTIGTLGIVDEYKEVETDRFEVIIYGLKKVEINEAAKTFTYRRGAVAIVEDNIQIHQEEMLRKKLISRFTDLLGLSHDEINMDMLNQAPISTEMLTNLICSMMPMDVNEKQKFLELPDVSLRLEVIIHFIESELEKETRYQKFLPILPLDPTLN